MIAWKGLDQNGLGSNELNDRFGESLAVGDFNGDGKDDLAVGAPGEAPSYDPKSGYVFTFKGDVNGPIAWKGLDQTNMGSNENDDQFGKSLAAGDFDGDGKDDLAVGAPGEAPSADPKSGYVFTFKGHINGLQSWKGLDQTGLGSNENGDKFGLSLAVGDFNGDGKDDLAVGAPGEAPGSDPQSGYVFTFKGQVAGLTAWQGLDQNGLGANENGDQFGRSLTSGDYNGDGISDLVVGAPYEAPGSDPQSGYVFSFKGSATGLTAWKGFDQNGLGANENGDRFGWSLASGDFNGDLKTDLTVGAPYEAPGSDPQSGYGFIFSGFGGLIPWHGIHQEQ